MQANKTNPKISVSLSDKTQKPDFFETFLEYLSPQFWKDCLIAQTHILFVTF